MKETKGKGAVQCLGGTFSPILPRIAHYGRKPLQKKKNIAVTMSFAVVCIHEGRGGGRWHGNCVTLLVSFLRTPKKSLAGDHNDFLSGLGDSSTVCDDSKIYLLFPIRPIMVGPIISLSPMLADF